MNNINHTEQEKAIQYDSQLNDRSEYSCIEMASCKLTLNQLKQFEQELKVSKQNLANIQQNQGSEKNNFGQFQSNQHSNSQTEQQIKAEIQSLYNSFESQITRPYGIIKYLSSVNLKKERSTKFQSFIKYIGDIWCSCFQNKQKLQKPLLPNSIENQELFFLEDTEKCLYLEVLINSFVVIVKTLVNMIGKSNLLNQFEKQTICQLNNKINQDLKTIEQNEEIIQRLEAQINQKQININQHELTQEEQRGIMKKQQQTLFDNQNEFQKLKEQVNLLTFQNKELQNKNELFQKQSHLYKQHFEQEQQTNSKQQEIIQDLQDQLQDQQNQSNIIDQLSLNYQKQSVILQQLLAQSKLLIEEVSTLKKDKVDLEDKINYLNHQLAEKEILLQLFNKKIKDEVQKVDVYKLKVKENEFDQVDLQEELQQFQFLEKEAKKKQGDETYYGMVSNQNFEQLSLIVSKKSLKLINNHLKQQEKLEQKMQTVNYQANQCAEELCQFGYEQTRQSEYQNCDAQNINNQAVQKEEAKGQDQESKIEGQIINNQGINKEQNSEELQNDDISETDLEECKQGKVNDQ